jgi:opacity protein-like surface antigen
MKRITLAVLFLAVTFSTGSWAAASGTSWLPKIHVQGGFGLPQMADFKYGWKAGLGGGIGIEKAVAKNLSISLDVDYNHHGLNEEHFTSDVISYVISDFKAHSGLTNDPVVSGVIINGGSASILTTMTTVKLDLPTSSSITPYLMLGAGLGRIMLSKSNLSFIVTFPGEGWSVPPLGFVTPFDDTYALATSVGAGLRQQPRGSRVGYTIEARWIRIASEGGATHMVPVRAGFVLGF